MSGLPRKETLKKFKKFCKASGKSKTNVMSGAYDISKQKIHTKENMITKFNLYEKTFFTNIWNFFKDGISNMFAEISIDDIIKDYTDNINLQKTLFIFLKWLYKISKERQIEVNVNDDNINLQLTKIINLYIEKYPGDINHSDDLKMFLLWLYQTHLKKIKLNENLERPELIQSIREYLLTEYPSNWWNNEFYNRVYDYISHDDIVGNGDEDDQKTWDYEDEEDAYRNLSTGGAIEYDIIDEIGKNIIKKFNLKDYDEYFNLGIGDLVEEYMCNMIDWYDHFLFGKDKRDPSDLFGFRKKYQDLMNRWDNINDDGQGNKL